MKLFCILNVYVINNDMLKTLLSVVFQNKKMF
jgi:hypothetical protein